MSDRFRSRTGPLSRRLRMMRDRFRALVMRSGQRMGRPDGDGSSRERRPGAKRRSGRKWRRVRRNDWVWAVLAGSLAVALLLTAGMLIDRSRAFGGSADLKQSIEPQRSADPLVAQPAG